MAIYKDKSMAEKNCTFGDADKDGIITEAEYVKQGSNVGKKKEPVSARGSRTHKG